MFRNNTTTETQLRERFFVLKKKLDQLGDVYVDTEYHSEMRKYIEQLTPLLQGAYDLDAIRESNMTRLNRLQKLKNATTYKKEKHSKKLI